MVWETKTSKAVILKMEMRVKSIIHQVQEIQYQIRIIPLLKTITKVSMKE